MAQRARSSPWCCVMGVSCQAFRAPSFAPQVLAILCSAGRLFFTPVLISKKSALGSEAPADELFDLTGAPHE